MLILVVYGFSCSVFLSLWDIILLLINLFRFQTWILPSWVLGLFPLFHITIKFPVQCDLFLKFTYLWPEQPSHLEKLLPNRVGFSKYRIPGLIVRPCLKKTKCNYFQLIPLVLIFICRTKRFSLFYGCISREIFCSTGPGFELNITTLFFCISFQITSGGHFVFHFKSSPSI